MMLSAIEPDAAPSHEQFDASAHPPASFAVCAYDRIADVSSDWPVGGNVATRARYHVFQTRTFLEVWCATFGTARNVRTFFVEVRDGFGAPVLFLPLAITRRAGARVLSFIDEEVADYNTPVLFPVAWSWDIGAAETLMRAIIGALPAFDVLRFDKMPVEVGGLVNPLNLLADGTNDVQCHAVNLKRSLAEIEKSQPQRKTMARKMRGLERMAPTHLVIAETEAQRSAMLECFLKQKQRRFEETRVPGFDSVPAKEAFFRLGTETFAKAGMMRFSALYVGDEIVATLWGLVDKKYYYGLMLSFEGEAWEKHSVGRISFLWTQEWLHKNGFEVLDLGIGDETWKLEHCDITVPLSRKEVVMTLKGRIHVMRRRFVEKLQSLPLWQRLRPYKWIVLRSLRRLVSRTPNTAQD
jgi:CelD/BcsL family acetyltransferase involved in cellulose biosynthesis